MTQATATDNAATDPYGLRGWGGRFFSIDGARLVVHPDGPGSGRIVLAEVVDQLRSEGHGLPLLIRFPEIIRARLSELHQAFARAIDEYAYRGSYRGVYPIKVNQDRFVVEHLVGYGRPFHFGLEAGSKPELLAAIAMLRDDDSLIVCNGYKDEEYIETALLASRLGPRIVLVAEKLSELHLVAAVARRTGIRPTVGARARLSSPGAGHWEASGGDRSKFGLGARELVEAVDVLSAEGLLESFELLHFHLGSQISSIRAIQDGLQEAVRLYTDLVAMGAPMGYLDVGGGLGVDYSGSLADLPSSMNYTLQEYANDLVYGVSEVCDQAGVEHPVLVSESGRATVAHHAVLIVDVVGTSQISAGEPPGEIPENAEPALRNLFETHQELSPRNVLEAFHDAVAYREECLTLFRLGHLSLERRALAGELYDSICAKVVNIARGMSQPPEELAALEAELADTYFCNFSLFQSIPDSWAIDQLFPILPIHRLDEEAAARVVLADLTCDSDGKVDRFIPELGRTAPRRVLEIPAYDGSPYYLGIFLVGAYQEILGDLHNLFGDTNIAHVVQDPAQGYRIESRVMGNTVAEVLSYVRYQPAELLSRLRARIGRSQSAGGITVAEAERLERAYEDGLRGYTYLEP